jgi:hypothetical protein
LAIARKLTGILLSLLLGIVFIYSGYSKLWPLVETFELTLVDASLSNWYTAPLLARFLIGLEFFTGACLIASYNLKRFTIPLTLILLIVFTVYLLISLAKNGNTFNCGCFGEHIVMSPVNAIIKNVIMMVVAFIIWICYGGWQTSYNKLLISSALVTCCALPFIINVVDYSYTSNNLNEKTGYPLQLELLYEPEDPSKVEIPVVDLRKGRHVIAFMSLGCPHCRIAAKKFRIFKQHDSTLPLYLVLNGEQKMLPVFLKDTGCEFIPHSMCLGKSFVQLASTHLPSIYYINNAIIEKKVTYIEMTENDVRNWSKQP